MVNEEIVSRIREKMKEGLDIRTICNILVNEGYDQLEINSAVDFVEHQRRLKQIEAAGGGINENNKEENPFKDKNFLIYYIIAILIIVLSGAIALFYFGLI